MPPIIMCLGLTPGAIARLSASASSSQDLSLAAFTINIAESDFRHAQAERSGWKVVQVYEDAGISGAKDRDQRPGLDAMMKAVNAKKLDMVASWSVDRLGRSAPALLSTLHGLHEK